MFSLESYSLEISSKSYRKDTQNEPLWIELMASVVCFLSILGSLAIILTYVLVKNIRSKARELLVHISLMDIMYSTANLVGLALPYRKYLGHNSTVAHNSTSYHIYYNTCQAQASVAVYGTIGSVLWTLGLAVYLYYRVVSRDANVAKWVVRVLYIVCYTLPLYVSLWLLFSDQLGYYDSPLSGGGWCFVKSNVDPLVNFMAYDIWIWLGVILVPLYISIHVHIREEVQQYNNSPDYQFMIISNPMLAKTELKLLFIPVVFIVLRVWDLVGSILVVYCQCEPNHIFWLQILTAIGDSGQGMFNFIIFFLFQPKLRALLMKCICCCCNTSKCRRPPVYYLDNDDDDEDIDEDVMDESTSLQYRSRTSSQFSQYTT